MVFLGQLWFFLVIFCTIPKEVRVFSIYSLENLLLVQMPIYLSNLGRKIIGSFYIKFNKLAVAIKFFTCEAAAILLLKNCFAYKY